MKRCRSAGIFLLASLRLSGKSLRTLPEKIVPAKAQRRKGPEHLPSKTLNHPLVNLPRHAHVIEVVLADVRQPARAV
jgi:hypothetical protein